MNAIETMLALAGVIGLGVIAVTALARLAEKAWAGYLWFAAWAQRRFGRG